MKYINIKKGKKDTILKFFEGKKSKPFYNILKQYILLEKKIHIFMEYSRAVYLILTTQLFIVYKK